MAEAESDWDSVTYLRKKTPRAAELKSKQVTIIWPELTDPGEAYKFIRYE